MSKWDKLIARICNLSKDPITIPKHEPIKKVYVLMVRKVVESEERENENAE